MQIESLEDRCMMSTSLYWDPAGSQGSHLGGAGAWDTTTAAWYNPLTNTDVAWNNANGDTAVFSGPADAVTVSSGIAAGEVDFTAAGYTLQGGSLAISGTGTIDVGSGLTDTIGSVLNGSNGLTASDAGTLVITGINTYTGGTTVAAGTLQLGDDSALSSGSVAITTGATLDSNGTNPTVEGLSGSGTLTNSAPPATSDFDGTAIPSSTLTVGADDISSSFGGTLQDGTGGLNLTKIGAGTLTLAGTDSYSGVTTISTGTLLASSASSLSANSAFEVDGTLDLGGNNESLGSLWGTGTVQSTGASNVTLRTGGDGSDALFSGVIQDGASSGSLALDATGSGVTALNDANTYSGGTTVDAGATFQLGDGMMNNGSIIGGIADSGTVQFANFTSQTFSAEISGDGGVSVSGPGVLTLEEASSFTGRTTVIAGATLQAGAENVLGPGSLIDVGGTFDLNGYDQTIDGLSGESGGQVALGGATLTIDGSDNGSTTFAGVISGAGNLHKLGTDTLVLTAANTYTGQTIIDDGAIVLGANNRAILNTPGDGAGPVNHVDLTYDYDTVGVTADGSGTTSGGLDGSGTTFSSSLLGASQTWNGDVFSIGAAGADSVITAAGQDIDLASVPLSKIEILATAIGGNQTAQTFTVNYTDGSSATFTQDMSSWTSSQSYSGESVALTMAYTNLADGSANDQAVNVYGYTLAVDPTKSVASITLPDNANVVLLAIDTVSPTDTATNLVAASASAGTVHLSWTAPSGTFTGYNVFRGQASGGELTLLNSSPLATTATTFDDTTVVPGNPYYYVVQTLGTSTQPSVETDLSSAFNVTGITTDGATFSGGLDGGGEALSETQLGASQAWNSAPVAIGAADQADVVRASGQTIVLSPGYYSSLDLLMTATNGNQPAQTFTVNYTDGTSTTFTQGISDWFTPQGYSGESVADATAYRNNADGTQDNRTFNVYGYTFALDSGKSVANITLPTNANVFLLAATAGMAGPVSNETSAATPTQGSTAQADLSSAFNHLGITADGSTFTGGLDGGGTALSGNQLGTSQTWNGANFVLGAAGTNDVVQATGQTIALPAGQYSQLELLATATNGNQAAQTFTVNYSDGSTVTFTQSVSDWFTPQGYSGESVAIATSYRNNANGTADNRTFNVYGYVFNLDSSKTVTSITLPTNSNLFLLAATEHAANILPTGGSVEINGQALLDLNGTDQTIGSLSGDGGTVLLSGATLTVGGDNSSTTYAGTITGTGNLTKTGTGTLTFSAGSDYSGATAIASGTLQAAADGVFDPDSAYVVNGILDLAGFSPTIGSLAGSGVVTNSGSSLATLIAGGDNTTTTFTGSLQDGATSQLSLDKLGSGTLVLSGQSDFSGATTIDAGTLEIDNSVIPTTVTINPSGTLQGSGGVQGVTNMGGTFVANLYDVSIATPSLQRGDTADASTGSIALRSGETGLVLAMSEMDAAFRELLGSATNTVTGLSYSTDNQTNLVNGLEPSRPAFVYEDSFSAPGVSYTGQALVLEDLDGLPYSDYDYNDDLFEIAVARNTTKPIARPDTYQDGVGGELNKDAAKGLLTNDTSQDSGNLTVYSVNGSFEPSVDDGKGTLEWNPDGSFVYTPDYGFFGTDTFTYDDADTVTNGSDSPTTTYSNKTTITFDVVLPSLDLLDDANNDGTTNSADEPVKNTSPGEIILADNASLAGTISANADYLAQENITLDAAHTFTVSSNSLPYDLRGWTLTLTATNDDGTVQIFDSNMNEIDGASTGKVSWDLSDGLTSVPTSVYVATADSQNIDVQLAYAPPADANSAPSQTVPMDQDQVTAREARLIASTVDTSQGKVVITGILATGAMAYVPLSNEDQNYIEAANTNKLILDMNQTENGTISPIQADKFLLPIAVDLGAYPTYPNYSLVIPAGLRIWQTADRTGQIMSSADIHTLFPQGGSVELYAEGTAQGVYDLELHALVNGNDTLLAKLSVTVFAFSGPQNVPNYSSYKYSVSGLPAGAASTWTVNNRGSLQSNAPSVASVYWGAGGLNGFGWTSYKINQNYTWSYYVNIVKITVQNSPTGSFNGDPNAGIYQDFVGIRPAVNGSLSVGIGTTSTINQGDEAIRPTALISLLGPHGNAPSPQFGQPVIPVNWGADQIVVGFTQTLESFIATAHYGTAGNRQDTAVLGMPAPDVIQATTTSWYFKIQPGAAGLKIFEGQLIVDPGGSDIETPQKISVSDAPSLTIPAYYNLTNDPTKGDTPLQYVELSQTFEIDVSAGVFDPTAPSLAGVVNNEYTVLASAPWSWNGSGSFDPSNNFQHTPADSSGIQRPLGWQDVTSGEQFRAGLPTASQVLRNGKWVSVL